MNIVQFWQQQVADWNTEIKCGLCWAFYAPLIESEVGKVQPETNKECCVQVHLLRDKGPAFNTQNQYDLNTGLLNGVTENISFQLLVLLPSTMGTNSFNEIQGHPESESKWNTNLYRIEECLRTDAHLAFCEIIGRKYRVTTWQGTQVINYGDEAMDGYRITVNFQQVR